MICERDLENIGGFIGWFLSVTWGVVLFFWCVFYGGSGLKTKSLFMVVLGRRDA